MARSLMTHERHRPASSSDAVTSLPGRMESDRPLTAHNFSGAPKIAKIRVGCLDLTIDLSAPAKIGFCHERNYRRSVRKIQIDPARGLVVVRSCRDYDDTAGRQAGEVCGG